ncbi:V-type ATP synthase subunit F [Methanobacterium alkalithermotolerans]|uniref:A-type ATP synthase subunit F n=1 Tax=Methanobacterium alkalithermotolerans TaxID=2731220 RepID=A0A8T8KC74_9EURY|nr:V-type ATP synthase subunit F [Methanobacterium alkalithermotolerans]QUH22971.1 V-type ATP synthase subunit F [Methanobacterium alkalithermotolerans]RJS48214.1 MAG: V-type ATP synthase subunit F [Methanobacterium sp.]
MKSSIAVVADADTVTGFKLGGIKEGYVVESTQEAEETLTTLIKEKTAIIIITEKIGEELREVIEKFTKSSALPMIIEIPDKSGPSDRATDPMRELIKRVIGVEMVK